MVIEYSCIVNKTYLRVLAFCLRILNCKDGDRIIENNGNTARTCDF